MKINETTPEVRRSSDTFMCPISVKALFSVHAYASKGKYLSPIYPIRHCFRQPFRSLALPRARSVAWNLPQFPMQLDSENCWGLSWNML